MEGFAIYFITMYFWMLSPGPSMAIIARTSVKYSIKSANFVVLGILTSVFFYTILSIVGVGALINAHPTGFKVFKIAGSLYIAYVGIKIFIHSFAKMNQDFKDSGPKLPSKTNLYFGGFLTDISNPLTMVGITAIILEFVSIDDSTFHKFIFLILTMVAGACYTYTFAFLFGNKISRKFIIPRMNIFERTAGIAIALIGCGFLIKTFS